MKSKKQNLEIRKSATRALWDASRDARLAWAEPLRPILLLVVASILMLAILSNGLELDGFHASIKFGWNLVFLLIPFAILFAKNKASGGDTDFDPVGAAIDANPTLHNFVSWLVSPNPLLALLVSFISFISIPPAAPPRRSLAG